MNCGNNSPFKKRYTKKHAVIIMSNENSIEKNQEWPLIELKTLLYLSIINPSILWIPPSNSTIS